MLIYICILSASTSTSMMNDENMMRSKYLNISQFGHDRTPIFNLSHMGTVEYIIYTDSMSRFYTVYHI